MIAPTVIAYLAQCDLHQARMPIVAKALGMHRWTLVQTLNSEGTLFMTLLDAERKRRCADLLKINPHSDGGLIAKKCGFSNSNTARRSFKKWFGLGLTEFKSRKLSALGWPMEEK